jgi:hypothetical protein
MNLTELKEKNDELEVPCHVVNSYFNFKEFKGIQRNLKEFKGILAAFGYLISIFKLLQTIAVRIFFNSPVANNQPLYIILLARQHCWLPTINIQ